MTSLQVYNRKWK